MIALCMRTARAEIDYDAINKAMGEPRARGVESGPSDRHGSCASKGRGVGTWLGTALPRRGATFLKICITKP